MLLILSTIPGFQLIVEMNPNRHLHIVFVIFRIPGFINQPVITTQLSIIYYSNYSRKPPCIIIEKMV